MWLCEQSLVILAFLRELLFYENYRNFKFTKMNRFFEVWTWAGTRYDLEILQQFGNRVKTKSERVFWAKPYYALRGFMGKTGSERGPCPLSSWIGLTQVEKTFKELLIADSYNKMKLTSIQIGEEGTNLQSCSYYFETFWWFRKFFFRHKWNEAWLLVIKWYIRVASRVDEQLETLGNQELSRNSQNSIE